MIWRARACASSTARRGRPTARNADPVAEEVAAGRADAGFGLRADATRHALAFAPLAMERYFFACAKAPLPGAG